MDFELTATPSAGDVSVASISSGPLLSIAHKSGGDEKEEWFWPEFHQHLELSDWGPQGHNPQKILVAVDQCVSPCQSVRPACISCKISYWEDITGLAGEISVMVWCSVRPLVCLSVWASSVAGGGSARDLDV